MCKHIHAYAHAHAHSSLYRCMHVQLGLQNYVKGIYIYIYIFSFKFVWNESRIIWELPHTPILPLYKAIKYTFSERGEYTQDWLKNSESKREFFTKHSQVMFCLLGSYFGLGLWVLKLTNLLVFLLVRLIEGKSNQSLKSSCIEVNVLTLALHFLSLSLFFFFFLVLFTCFITFTVFMLT